MIGTGRFQDEKVRGKELSDHGKRYPSVGKYVLTRIEEVYSPEDSTNIYVKIDTPEYDDGIWTFDYPYSWNPEIDMSFPQFAEELGYNRNNFEEIEGSPVLLKPDSDGNLKKLILNNPEDRIQELYRERDVHVSEIDTIEINERFDIDLPFDVPEYKEIVCEKSAKEIGYK
jgi:hypothetical protein